MRATVIERDCKSPNSSPANCKFAGTGGGATLKTFTYLVGPCGVFAVVEHDDEERIHYILKDHLGSWTTITDAEGVVEQELSFDAWGNLRNPATWNGSFSGTPMFDRGYTGHEHIPDFGLINMNGRCYDPLMSSFLSVDAYVQSPDNSQSFNRYAYCLNNPLKYTDPSGWQMVGGTTPSNPFHENWGVNFAEHVVTSHEARQILWDMGALGVWMEENEVHGGGEPYDGSGDDDKNKKKNGDKSKQAKDAMNYTNGVVTLVGGAAKNVSKESSFFKFFGVGCQVISYTGLVINAYNNWNKYDNSEITLYSFVARNVNSVGELALTYIPYGIGVPFSITITAVDICGGFDNNIYNEEWMKGVLNEIKDFVTPKRTVYEQSPIIYYRHGW